MSSATCISSAMSQITAEPPALPADVVAREVATQFGLSGNYTPLISEYDQNFCMVTAEGERFVVKIVGSVEAPERTDFQIAALLHLETLDFAGVPRVVRTNAGETNGCIDFDGVNHRLRVVTYLDGVLLQHSEIIPQLARGFGKRLAELDLALQDFSHAGENHVLIWDMQRAADLRALMTHISDEPLRDSVDNVLEIFESRVLPLFKQLRHQVIHNDPNTENVLIDQAGAVSGFIDFTDMLRAPLIVEVAVAAAYLRTDCENPARLIAPFIRGYHEQYPLEEQELSLLFDLVRTRAAMTIAMLFWRLSARDADDPYRQKTLQGEGSAIRFLQALSAQGKEAFMERITRESTAP